MTRLLGKDSPVPKEKRILFLGDSITDDGLYIAFMDAYFREQMPDNTIMMINLGVSSETVSGLSESDHPFIRPCVHSRLSRALKETRPEWVVIGYGMNDGIYAPFSSARFQVYQEGMLKAIQLIQRTGAKAIVMTPPPFDPVSMKETVFLEDGQENYSYLTPYAHYNEVLRRYSEWLLSLGTRVDSIVNIFEPLLQDIKQKRQLHTDYQSGDGIHPDASGHWIIAKALLSRLFNISLERIPEYVEYPEQSELFTLILERHRLLSSAWKEYVGHTNPNKAEALPLEQALTRGEKIAEQIRQWAAQKEDRHSNKHSIY
jgi:lysophospholipase L1-like esterase